MTTTKKRTTSTSRSSAAKSTDATTLLKHDHDAVKKMFQQFEKSTDRKLAQEICMELTVHTQLEEQAFYPPIRKLSGLEDMVIESLEEHRQAKEMIERVRSSTDQLEPEMKVLIEDVLHHVEEEEKQMFPKLRKQMDKQQLETLGQSMLKTKMSLKAQMGAPMRPDEKRVVEEVREPSRSHSR